MGNVKSVQPDAPESNAGDDFHLVWAARRALLLLNLQGKLKAIRPEGPALQDSAEVDPDGDQLLGIDLSEYYEGTCFNSASRVVHSQLKYSTRQSKKAWTAARLASGKNGTHAGSIVHRLAQVFTGYLEQYGRDAVLEKLQIHLVSNRPCDANLIKALESVRGILGGTTEVQYASLQKKLKTAEKESISRIRDGTGLPKSSKFCDFLRVLDLSHCGEGSRLDQDFALKRELGQLGFEDVRCQYDELIGLLRRRILPESRCRDVLTADDIVPALGIPSVEHLFPAQPRLDKSDDFVERVQAEDIARTIVQAEGKTICLHGNAGVGKTTLVQSLKSHLPKGSLFVLFDCYGGGSYLDPSEVRHGHSRAIMQIANELATYGRSSLLLNRNQPAPELLRNLTKRLQCASKALSSLFPSALVVIVIDAADNALAAAAARNEPCFVSDLVQCHLPPRCRLVVTARTYRLDSLALPSNAERCLIQPFTPDESRDNFQRCCADATTAQCEEFHKLSYSVPRVQGYALSKKGGGPDAVLAALRPSGKTVETLIDGSLLTASTRLGDPRLHEKICPAMLALPRPVPIKYLALLAETNEQAVTDFCIDMFPGIQLKNDVFSFADEDFENHLQQCFPPDSAVHESLLKILAHHSKEENYAAAHIADVLQQLGRRSQLIDLIYKERQPISVVDPIERKEVFARRARFAMAAAIRDNRQADLMKLIFIFAEAAKADQAVEQLLLNHADLACRYGNPATVQRLYLNEKNTRVSWYGPNHLLCAANFARNVETLDRAKSHFRSAEAWIRWWLDLSEDARNNYSFDADDLALAAETVFRISGFRNATKWLSRWQPASVVFSAARRLARNVIAIDGEGAFGLIENERLRADVLLAIIEAGVERGIIPPSSLVLRAVTFWQRFTSRFRKLEDTIRRGGILLCEAAVWHGISLESIPALLRSFSPGSFGHSHVYSDDVARDYDSFLRAQVLLAILERRELTSNNEMLLPDRLREKKAEPEQIDEQERERRARQEEIERFRKLHANTIPAYQLRANALTRKLDGADCQARFSSVLNSASARSYGWREIEPPVVTLVATTLADAVRYGVSDIETIFATIAEHYSKDRWIYLMLQLAESASVLPVLGGETIRLVDKVHAILTHTPRPGQQQINILVKCSRIVGAIDSKLGRRYFELAIEAASAIDEEAVGLLELLSALAERAGRDSSHLNDVELAGHFAEIAEDCWKHLGDSGNFPWRASIRGIVCLSPPVAALAVCRWDHRGVLNFPDYAATLANIYLERHVITPISAVAWVLLSELGSADALAVSLEAIAMLHDDPSVDVALTFLVDYVTRLTPLDSRLSLCRHMVEWAEKNAALNRPQFREVSRISEFLEAAMYSDSTGTSYRGTHPGVTPQNTGIHVQELHDIREEFGQTRYLTKDEIEHELRGFVDPPTTDLEMWAEQQRQIPVFLRKIKLLPQPSELTDQLNALLSVDAELLNFYELIEALQDRLSEWSYHPSVREWMERLPERLADSRFTAFIDDDHFSKHRLEELNTTLRIPQERMLKCLVDELPTHLRKMSANVLYELAMVFTPQLEHGVANSTLQWVIPDLASRLRCSEANLLEMTPSDLPSGNDGLEAAILWYLLGHPDKRIRWRAAHMARQQVRLGNTTILRSIAEWLARDFKHPFSSPNAVFYGLAARQWFFVLMDRLSVENPECVLPLAATISEEVLSPRVPHALIMHLAKRASLRIAKHNSKPYTPQQVQCLSKAITSPFAIRKEDSNTALQSSQHRTSKCRFHFDSIDTIPYWYERAASVFGSSTDEFCHYADRWICDEWKFFGDVWEKDITHKWANHDSWDLTSHRHGSPPTVENLATYLEFNAMFCVAAEWISTRPTVESNWDGDRWDAWLNRWDLEAPGTWAADRRQRTPMESAFWVESRNDKWDEPPTNPDFDRAVGLIDPLHKGCIIVDGSLHRYMYDDYERAGIYSALVSPHAAHALLYALYWSRHPHDYRVPRVGDELEIDKNICGQQFKFYGWTEEDFSDAERIDQHDPLRYQLQNVVLRPGTTFVQKMGLVRADLMGCVFRSRSSGRIVTLYEHWNDCRGGRYERGFRTEGRRLWVDVKEMLMFLRKYNWSLLLKCEIDRHLRDTDASKKWDEYEINAKLYLINADGSIESIAGRYCLGKKNC